MILRTTPYNKLTTPYLLHTVTVQTTGAWQLMQKATNGRHFSSTCLQWLPHHVQLFINSDNRGLSHRKHTHRLPNAAWRSLMLHLHVACWACKSTFRLGPLNVQCEQFFQPGNCAMVQDPTVTFLVPQKAGPEGEHGRKFVIWAGLLFCRLVALALLCSPPIFPALCLYPHSCL